MSTTKPSRFFTRKTGLPPCTARSTPKRPALSPCGPTFILGYNGIAGGNAGILFPEASTTHARFVSWNTAASDAADDAQFYKAVIDELQGVACQNEAHDLFHYKYPGRAQKTEEKTAVPEYAVGDDQANNQGRDQKIESE